MSSSHVFYQDDAVQMLHGDATAMLRTLPDQYVQTVVTSPPYWGLRDYGIEGQLGLEATPADYVSKMVEVFREVRRVLRDDGTLWLNMGDCYSAAPRGSIGSKSTLAGSRHNQEESRKAQDSRGYRGDRLANGHGHLTQRKSNPSYRRDKADCGAVKHRRVDALKPKDLVGMPWRLAFALQDDGWYLRIDIIWAKPNPMPESVTDRPTKSHEYIFLMSKRERYFYNADAIKEPVSGTAHARGNGVNPKAVKIPAGWDTTKGNGAHGNIRKNPEKGSAKRPRQNESFSAAVSALVTERNKRSVWTVATEAYPEAHFATYPTRLIEPCILAGSRPGDVVMDPFHGAGTTAMVAKQFNRKYVGMDINEDYLKLSLKRLAQEVLPLS